MQEFDQSEAVSSRSRRFNPLPSILVACSIVVLLGCSNMGSQPPNDPSGIGLKAFCGLEDALANSKSDWAAMTSPDSEIEDALAAADRLERSYKFGSESLALVPTTNPVYPSAHYVKTFTDQLSDIFGSFKRGFVEQDMGLVEATKERYTSVYNDLTTALTGGEIPGAEAFSSIVGYMGTTCTGAITQYSPADSTTAVDSQENFVACQSNGNSYSVNQAFLDLQALDPESFTDGNLAALEPLSEIGVQLQPLLVKSSGPLLVGIAKLSSGLLTMYEAGKSNLSDLLPAAQQAISDGIELAGKACRDIGIEFKSE